MTKKLPVLLTLLTALAGASYAFADGILNDAAYTREHGGVGNYLFRYGGETRTTTADNLSDNDAVDSERYETADTTTDANDNTAVVTDADTSDEIDLGASSAGRAH